MYYAEIRVGKNFDTFFLNLSIMILCNYAESRVGKIFETFSSISHHNTNTSSHRRLLISCTTNAILLVILTKLQCICKWSLQSFNYVGNMFQTH